MLFPIGEGYGCLTCLKIAEAADAVYPLEKVEKRKPAPKGRPIQRKKAPKSGSIFIGFPAKAVPEFYTPDQPDAKIILDNSEAS